MSVEGSSEVGLGEEVGELTDGYAGLAEYLNAGKGSEVRMHDPTGIERRSLYQLPVLVPASQSLSYLPSLCQSHVIRLRL